jgi:hypothetical protein
MTNGPEDLSSSKPRFEAQPFAWKGLTDPQKTAARQLWLMLRCYLDDPLAESRYASQPDDPWRRILPAIDRERRNRILLIDGERGSGKTSLLLSMLAEWNKAVREPQSGASQVGATPPEVSAIESLSELADYCGQLVPLRLLELRGVGRTAPLLPYFVMALLDLVDELAPDPLASVLEDDDGKDDGRELRHAWEALMRAATSPSQRALLSGANLPPETYARELRQADRGHLDLRQRAGEFFDELYRRFKSWSGSQGAQHPLFLIAIDDADMNPARALEAAELMETLYHPRLVFLIAGHSPLFYSLLRVHFLAALREPMQGLARHEEDGDIAGDNLTAATLARRFYDKLIPIQQRFSLPILSPRERVEVLLDDPVLPKLKLPRLYATFADLLRAEPFRGHALPDTIRELVDLRSLLVSEPTHAAFHLLEYLGRRQLDYGRDQREEVRQGIEQLIERREVRQPTNPAEQYIINLDGFRANLETEEWHDLTVSEQVSYRVISRHRVEVYATREVELEQPSAYEFFEVNSEAHEERLLLLPETAALWLLASEVYSTYRGTITITSKAPIFRADFGSTECRTEGDVPFVARWPRPFLPGLVLRQSESWRQTVTRLLSSHEGSSEEFLELLLGNLVIVLHSIRPRVLITDVQLLWPKVMTFLARQMEHTENAAILLPWMEREVLRILFPEYGLGPAAVRRIIAAGRDVFGERFADMLVAAQDHRHRGLAKWCAKKGRPVDLQLRALEQARPEVPELIEILSQPRLRLVEEFVSTLGAIEIGPESEPERGLWQPRTLADYLSDDLVQRLRQVDVVPRNLRSLTEVFARATKPDVDVREVLVTALTTSVELIQDRHNRRLWPGQKIPTAHWQGGRLTLNGGQIGLSGSPMQPPQVCGTAQRNVTATLLQPQMSDAGLPADCASAYTIIHDYLGDLSYATGGVAADYWPLLSTFVKSEGLEVNPWPSVEWFTRRDLALTLEGWDRIVKMAELGPSTIELFARRFTAVHVAVFRERRLPDEVEMTEPGSWAELISSAQEALPSWPHPRNTRYERWFRRLLSLAVPWAGLSDEDAIELLLALSDAGLVSPANFDLVRQGRGISFAEAFPEHPWVRLMQAHLQNAESVQRVLAEFRGE